MSVIKGQLFPPAMVTNGLIIIAPLCISDPGLIHLVFVKRLEGSLRTRWAAEIIAYL